MKSVPLPADRKWPPRGATADRVLGAVLAGTSVVEVVGVGFGADTVVVSGLCVVVGVCVAWRRTRPLVAIAVGMGAYALLAVVDVDSNDLLVVTASLMVLVYSVAMWEPRRESLAGLALAVLAVSAVVFGEGGKPLSDYVYVDSLVVAAWGLGRAMRARLLQVSELAQQAARAELAREHEAAAAVAEERNRIARELHDIVSHGLSVIVVQAAAAEPAVADAPDAAVDALRSIQDVGREAQSEMIRMLRVLREGHGDSVLSPMPGVDDIASLIDRTRSAGLPVQLTVTGDPHPLPAGVGLAAYRIVQEALTNVRRHAGAVATAVHLAHTPSSLQVTVSNTAGTSDAATGAGMGLTGMRERAAMYGGTVTAGPASDGTFVVTANLPTPTP
jgi:signal transduction histidine kinase